MGILCSKLRKQSSNSSSRSATLSSAHLNLPPLARSSPVTLTTTQTPAYTVPTVTTNPPFPLLQLPLVAIHEVLRTMILLEIVQLSLVSKKTRRFVESFVKKSSRKNNYKLEVFINDKDDELLMKLYCGERKPLVIEFKGYYKRLPRYAIDSQVSENSIKFADGSVHLKVNQSMHKIVAYWKFRDSAIKTMLQYIIKTFNPGISIKFDSVGEFLVSGTLNVLKQQNAKLDELSISRYFACLQAYQELLGLSIRKLTILNFPEGDFCYKPSDEPMEFEELKITKAHWITELEYFLHCKAISLGEIKLKEQDLNKFLKKWIESDSPLQYAVLSVNDSRTLNLKSIIEGTLALPMKRASVGEHFKEFEDGKCYGVQRKNGEKANVYQFHPFSVIIKTESLRHPPRF